MTHHFPLDPRTILGVSADAGPDAVREAFREKSKKHHPDVGGDEWAFRMVLRAYELLKSEAPAPGVGPEASPPADARPPEDPPWLRPSARSPFFTQGRFPFDPDAEHRDAEDDPGEAEAEAGAPPPPQAPPHYRTVEVELIWIRLSPSDAPGTAVEEAEGAGVSTLSVCLVVSWPDRELVATASRYADLGASLHHVIDAFQAVRDRGGVLGARSRIEDGQFVGWLSLPDVVSAQDAFLALRDGLAVHGLGVRLQTRDETIPSGWTAVGAASR